MRIHRLSTRSARSLDPRRRRGASAVEFALTLPILMAIVSAVVDYSWYLAQVSSVMHAVREGTRYGATIDQDDGPTTEAIAQTEAALTALGIDCSGGASCTIDATLGNTGGLDSLTVEATIIFEPMLGIVPTPPSLHGILTMALEDQPDEE